MTREGKGAWGGRRHRQAVNGVAGFSRKSSPAPSYRLWRSRLTGKALKVALVACMRKLLTILNAVMKYQCTWRLAVAATA